MDPDQTRKSSQDALNHGTDSVRQGERTIGAPLAINTAELTSAEPPRAIGRARIGFANGRLKDLSQAGSSKVLFPHGTAPLAVLLNTSGGVTGGDRFQTEISVETGALTVTTQAAERIYAAQTGQTGRVSTEITVGDAARLNWLPQETIIFDRAALDRRLTAKLTGTARLFATETLIFGRTAMGETVREAALSDHVDILRDGRLIAADRIRLTGDVSKHLENAAVAGSGIAIASIWYISPDAEARIDAARALAEPRGSASLPAPGVLFARIIGADGYLLRKTLVPLIEALSDAPVPKPWKI